MASSLVTDLLQGVHDACVDDRSGVSRDPIPELETIDPDAFGICLATVDGHVYEVGDTRARFPIQSISKAFTYGLALEDRGAEAVAAKLDVEPSGEPYNEISVDSRTGRPRNPMINAGAITASSLDRRRHAGRAVRARADGVLRVRGSPARARRGRAAQRAANR